VVVLALAVEEVWGRPSPRWTRAVQDDEDRRLAVVLALVFAPGSESTVPVSVALVAGVLVFAPDLAVSTVAALVVSAVLAALACLLPFVALAPAPPAPVARVRGPSQREATQVYWKILKPPPNHASEK
jgi:hypothetical protein